MVDWTIMLYIAADGVLANFAVESLKEFKKPSSTPDGSKDGARAPARSNVEVNVIAGAHFAFPTKQASLDAKASGKETEANSDGVTDNKVPFLAPKLAAMLVKPPDKINVSQKDALKRFLKSASEEPNFEAKQYALILWGHGPELLLQPAASDQTDGSKMYITPEDLREVLKPWIDVNLKGKDRGPKLDLIGFDACFMSMFEMADEIRDCAHYMVASQDEVPDASFPYEKLVALFREYGNDTESLLKKGVDEYLDTYGDSIFGQSTGLNPVTLSVLRLDKGEDLRKAVNGLASALLHAPSDPRLLKELIEARKHSKDYASGLYVDLYDFCSKLSKGRVTNTIKEACVKVAGTDALEKVAGALTLSSDGTSDGLILKNRSADAKSHGISIYLPYLTDYQYAQVSRPLVKGGTRTSGVKGFSDMLNGGATEYLMCARRNMILDTESYYQGLKLASPQGESWYDFITNVWTKALIEEDPADLDFHYSAQQSWINLLRKPANLSMHCEPGRPLNRATRVRRK